MKANSLIDVPAFDKKKQHWNVVVESPRGSRHKFKFDPEMDTLMLHRMLPEGMTFPFDFGFLPQTLGADGDPLDVLVILNDGTFAGCVIPSRLIGVIEARQTELDGTQERNDRLLAIPTNARDEEDIKSAKQLDATLCSDIEQFFVTYNRIYGKRFEIMAIRGPKTADKLAEQGVRRFKKSKKSG